MDTAMRPFPRLRPDLFDALVALAVLALAAAVWAPLRRGGETEALTAVVYIDGEEADRWALASLGPDTHRRYSGGGYTVEVCCRPGGEEGVQVVWADCPTQDCVHTGRIYRSGQSIVCLPGRIIIRLEGGAADASGPDAVIG